MKKWLPEKQELYLTAPGNAIDCLDDVPAVARIAARQRSLLKCYQIIALAPFVVVLFVVPKVFQNAAGRGWD